MAAVGERKGSAMQNDAKFGLLAGVMGVVVVAVMSSQRPPEPQKKTDHPSSSVAAAKSEDARPTDSVAQAPDPRTSPVLRTKKDLDGATTSRGKDDDLDQ